MKLIALNSNISNHIYFVNDFSSEIYVVDTVCRSEVPQTPLILPILTTTTVMMPTSTLVNFSPTELVDTSTSEASFMSTSSSVVSSSKSLIVVYIFIAVVAVPGIAALLFFGIRKVYLSEKRKKILTLLSLNNQEDIPANSSSPLSFNMQNEIKPKNLTINYLSVLGKGSSSIVYRGKLVYKHLNI